MVDNGKRGEVMQLGPEARSVGKSPGEEDFSVTLRPLAWRCFRWDTRLEREKMIMLCLDGIQWNKVTLM